MKEEKAKTLLKPSKIHGDFPETKNPANLRQTKVDDDTQPENPHRNYHHDEFRNSTSVHDEVKHADDNDWNGEDA